MSKRPGSVDLVAAVYSVERLATTVRVIRRLDASPGLDRVVVVINNPALDDAVIAAALFGAGRRLTVIRHDNSGAEFGAYQAGLDLLKAESAKPVLIINDTVGTNHFVGDVFLRNFSRLATASGDSPVAVGEIDHTGAPLRLLGLASDNWIRSSIMVLNPPALRAIDYRIYDPALESLIVASDDPDVFFGAEVASPLREHIADWLFSSSGSRWYKAAALSADNAAQMAAKTRAILQEKYLSMRLKAAGVALRSPIGGRLWGRLHRFERGRAARLRARSPAPAP